MAKYIKYQWQECVLVAVLWCSVSFGIGCAIASIANL